MVLIIVAVAFGAVLGWLPGSSTGAAAVAKIPATAASSETAKLLSWCGVNTAAHSHTVAALCAVAAALAPGMVCLVLAAALRTGVQVRRAIAAGVVIFSFFTFAAVPTSTGTLALVLGLLVAVLVSVTFTSLVLVPVGVGLGWLGGWLVHVTLSGSNTWVDAATKILAETGNTPGLWRLGVAVATLLPIGCAAGALLRGPQKKH